MLGSLCMFFRKSKSPPDLTGGSISRAVLSLALPTLGALWLHSVFYLVDMFWVGRLGGEAIAAVSVAGFVLWLLLSLAEMVTTGVVAMVGRRMGARQQRHAAYFAWQGMGLGAAASLVFAAFFMAVKGHIFAFMQTSPEVTVFADDYLTPMLIGLPFLFLYYVLTAVYKACGDTRTPMVLLIGALFINALLDPFLIFGWAGLPAMGVAGAAWATVLARALSCLGAYALMPSFIRRYPAESNGRAFRPHWGAWLRKVKIGIPIAVEGVLFCFVYFFLTRITTRFGVAAVAALGVCHKIESLAYFVHVSFGEAASTLAAQNLGARKPERAERCAWTTSGIASVFSAVLGLLFFVFAEAILGFFTRDAAIVAHGARYLRIVAIPQIFSSLHHAVAGAFSGAGDTLPPTLITIPSILLRIPVAYWLSLRVLGAVDGVWWAIALTMVLNGTLLPLWFMRGNWKNKRV